MPTIALDIHTHQLPVDREALTACAGVTWDEEAWALVIDGHKVVFPPLYEPARLISWLDQNDIGVAWISAPPPSYRNHLDEGESVVWADYLNNGLRTISANSGGRLSPLYHLPVRWPLAAAEIVTRAVPSGQKRFSMPTAAGTETVLSSDAYQPLWAALNTAEATLVFHPAEPINDPRFAKFYLHNSLGNPIELTIAAGNLVFGRIIERHPRIKFVLVHGGGATAAVAGRMSRAKATDRPGVSPDMLEPAEALQRIYVDCIYHSPANLDLAENVFGEGRVLFGSDWPFPMGIPEPKVLLADISASQRERIFASGSEL